ncbi:hypothetical protein PV773_06365 [Mesorhizobium sp. CC13]|uniref:hypothetical protein n=1 Tax=Mesorhizobium sp. CC13 TaxID=3029194 RepID=UPI0032677239
MSAELPAYPDWTDYKKKSGLDPLGMQNSSINLYQRLLPGISNVTLRIRYYGLYAWLASTYARRVGDTNPKTWQKFVRRAEAVYALAAQRRGDEGGMAGVLWAQRKLDSDQESVVEFAPHADPGSDGAPYLQQAWGAYGAAYASQLFEIGVYAVAKDHQIPVPSPEFGEALGKAFEESAGPLAERFFDTIQSGVVTRTDLDDFSPLTPSSIPADSGERRLYQDLLFASGPLQRPADLSRRQTLQLLLQAAAHLHEGPDVGSARWLLYAGASPNDEKFKVGNPVLEQQRLRWAVYQANDLLHYSYETLLKFCLDALEDFPAGVGLNRLIADAVSSISEAAPSWPETWRDFLDGSPPAENANGGSPAAERKLTEAINATAGANQKTTAEAAWAALKLLAAVLGRSETVSAAMQTELGQLNGEGFHSLVTEMPFLNARKDEPFTRMIARIIEERVIKRHLWVAHRKFRYQNDYTFLFEVDDGRVRPRAQSGPVLTNPRLGPAITFLEDLHLIADQGLTVQGKALMGSP